MACGADPAGVHSWSLVLLHAFALHIATEGGQRFYSRLVHRTGRYLASADARVSSAGEPKNPGRSSHRPIFYARRFCLARAIVAGVGVPFSKTAQRASAG